MDPESREYLEALRHEFAAMREEMGSRFDAVDRRIEAEHETTRRLFHVVAFVDVRRQLADLRDRGAPR